MGKFVLLFTVVPLVELYLLTLLGEAMGFWNTVLLVVVTGLVGGWLAKLEGRRVWHKWQQSLSAGKLPEEGVVGGVLLLVGGVLLVTPGVLTDLTGLLLLIPPTRALIANKLVRPWLKGRMVARSARVEQGDFGQGDFGPGVGIGSRHPFEAHPFGGSPFGVDPTPRAARAPRVVVMRQPGVQSFVWGGQGGASPIDEPPPEPGVIDVEFEVKKVD